MLPARYTLILANRVSGVTHRLTLRLRPAAVLVALWVVLPGAWLIYSGLVAHTTVAELRNRAAQLEIENSSYRGTAAELGARIAEIQDAMTALAPRTDMPTQARRSIERLPEATFAGFPSLSSSDAAAAGHTFTLLDSLLGSLDGRLQLIRQGVAYREALTDATPLIWPADGWISGTYGYRDDPFTGQRDFHAGVDISTRTGRPVYATATGKVRSASRNGAYGNLVEIDHGFGLTTRYGHLSEFAVAGGETVERGDVIGYVGATGRATGAHVHYEVWAGDRTLDPMRLLPDSPADAAN